MIRQKGIVYFPVLLIVILLAIFISARYLSKNNSDLSIEPPSVFTLSVYLKTTEGKKLLYADTFGATSEADKEKVLSDIGSRLEQNNGFFDKTIISLQDKEIYFFDKTTSLLQTIPLPDEIVSLKKGDLSTSSLQLYVEELNDKYYLINFSHDQKDHYTYLLGKESSELTHLTQFDDQCKYIFCGGPEILKKLSENDFIFIQGAGDSCWNAGVVHKFNLKSREAVKLFDYSNGCSTEFDSYFGVFENNFVRAKHNTLDSYSTGAGPDQKISEVYLSGLNGFKKELISDSRMPAKIDNLWLDSDNGALYLYSNAENKYYRYGLKTEILENITKDSVVETKIQNVNQDKSIEESAKFLIVETNKGHPGKIKRAYTHGQSLGITDSNGTGMTILTDSFLDKVEFEKEVKECPYQKSPVSLNDRKFPFRFSSHKYEDSAKVLNDNEIMFVVISECGEYLSENGKRNEWFLGAKQFVLNISTGKIDLKAQLASPISVSLD